MPLALIETELIQSHGIFEFFSRKNDLFHTTEKEPNKCDSNFIATLTMQLNPKHQATKETECAA